MEEKTEGAQNAGWGARKSEVKKLSGETYIITGNENYKRF
jgi:hypothetical protein